MENKRRILGLILIIIILLVVGFFVFWNYNGKSQNVNINSACVKVPTTCCPCSTGGQEKCVNQSEAKAYQEKLTNCSKDIFCAAVYNCNNITCEEEC